MILYSGPPEYSNIQVKDGQKYLLAGKSSQPQGMAIGMSFWLRLEAASLD
jgi:hypothetical protein